MAKRLGSLEIKNFRQLRDLSIQELGHVNLIVGGNNSGKSTLLEALRLFAGKAAPSLIEELLVSHGELQSEIAVPRERLQTCSLDEGFHW
jgi:AAA15 family ATPase/GTPase